jgi:hypothetical protein
MQRVMISYVVDFPDDVSVEGFQSVVSDTAVRVLTVVDHRAMLAEVPVVEIDTDAHPGKSRSRPAV